MKFPDQPQDGRPVAQTIREILNYLRASRVVHINGKAGTESPNGTSFQIPVGGASTPTSGTSGVCFFGTLETWTEGEGEEAEIKTGIRGGTVYCGDKNFSVPRTELDLATDGVWLDYLEIDCESNMDDDSELILGGIKTSSETDPSTFWKTAAWTIGPPATQYPDNTNPTVGSAGIGTIVIPLGKLTIADGAATFVATGCGNIRIGQCEGTLSHTRG